MNFLVPIIGHPLGTRSRISTPALVKNQKISILGFVGHPVSAANTPLYRCGVKASTDKQKGTGMAVLRQNFIYKARFEFGLLGRIY